MPGWTLPGVMTTGAAQTLLRSYRVLPGRRVVVAGNGPLNLQVACELHRAGAKIVAVAELAPRPGAASLGALTPDGADRARGWSRKAPAICASCAGPGSRCCTGTC